MNIRTIVFATFFFSTMIIAIISVIPFLIFYIFRAKKCTNFLLILILQGWSKSLLWVAGMKRNVFGKENLPKENSVCFVSNHQSIFDILLILANVPKVIGFIAKKELLKMPFLNFWMIMIGCAFIDRKSRTQSMALIKDRLHQIHNGKPMLIFPEGTRSRCAEMNKFKTSGLQLVINEGITIVPLTVVDTYKCYEHNGNRVVGNKIELWIHKPVDVSQLSDEEKKNLIDTLQNIIAKPNENR